MNSTAASYTPLECLLLFQTLVAGGTEEHDFEHISNRLASNALIKGAETYDAQRLSADALRQLYLQLLRDELRSEEDVQEDHTSKKRKLPTPPIPSIKDAQEYREKLPMMVNRLYARYREHVIRAIKDDEREYAKLQEEIRQIERGEWDEKILLESKTTNGATEAPRSNGTEDSLEGTKESVVGKKTPHGSSRPSSRSEGVVVNNDPPNGHVAKPGSPGISEPSRVPAYPPPLSRPGSIGPHGPSPLQTPMHTGVEGQSYTGQPPQHYGPPGQLKWEHTFTPPQIHPGHQYLFNGQHSQQVPQYSPQSHPPPQPFSTPHGAVAPRPHVPSSPINHHPHPIVLPPPNSVPRPQGSPAMPLDALADAAGQQYRAHSGSPMMQQGHGSPVMQHGPPHGSPMLQHGLIHPGSPIMPQNAHGYPYTPQQRPGSANLQAQRNPQHPMQFQNASQYTPQPQQHLPFQPPPNLVSTQPKTYNSPYNPHLEGRSGQTPIFRSNLPSTPLSRTQPHLTGNGTVWTPNPSGSTPAKRDFTLIQSPAVEPISPILRPAELTEKKTPKKRTPNKSEAPNTLQSVEQLKKEVKLKAPRRGTQRPRAESVASSVIGGSHRSQSIISHTDELSLDNDVPNRTVKQEVATPVGVDDVGEVTADELPRHAATPKPSPRQQLKRKRASSILLENLTPIDIRPSVPPTRVLWTRAFPNISKSALESIAGHRNASTFSAPVKERDAPGYKTVILRPQDLKSIRTAISAGNRAASAAAPDDLPASASSVWLPISEDLIPPKGIINYPQLEKELMRMFANAVMFNPDPDRGLGSRWHGMGKDKGDVIGYEIDEDGVVKDTKAMFTDVEKIVGSLRSAERRSEENRESSMAMAAVEDDDIDELAGDGESHIGNTGTVKRRRKA